MQGAGPALGSVFGGLVANASANWRWVMWLNAIPSGICMLLVIALIPETNYHRTVEANKAGVTTSQLAEMRSNLRFRKRSALGLTNWYDRYVLFACSDQSDFC
jgi:MFS family permease